MGGRKRPPFFLGLTRLGVAGAKIAIQGDRFTTTGMGAQYNGAVQLDESKTPPQIDLKFESGPEKGNTNLGIYELDSDTWKLCLATRGPARPATFATKPGTGIALEVLQRAS